MTNWRSLPSLSALRAFTAFAEQPTLERAGAAIGVTHAAISQQIRGLERELGLRLAERAGRSLVPTAEGRLLAQALAEGFGRIEAAIATLKEADGSRPLRVSTTPTFAGSWLVPRLPDFNASHPGIALAIDATPDLRRLPEDADVAVRYGHGAWHGVESRCLLQTPIVVVAAPSILPPDRAPALEAAEGLPWLQEIGTNETSALFASRGLMRQKSAGITSMPGNLVLDAARNGQGMAVVTRAFVEADIDAGRLVVLHENREREGYFLVVPTGPQRESVRFFCDWVLRQAAAIDLGQGAGRAVARQSARHRVHPGG